MVIRKLYYLLVKYKILKPRVRKIEKVFKGKYGIEIGGRSEIFMSNGEIPIYDSVSNLDNCVYSSNPWWNTQSVWEYRFTESKAGKQFVMDAVSLNSIQDNTYDFLICSGVIEHIANPIKALLEWKRIVKNNGYILIVTSNKMSNANHRRKNTTYAHILDDYSNDIQENDLTHIEEMYRNYDAKRDLWANNRKYFLKVLKDNSENRQVCHHVFSISLLCSVFAFSQIKLLMTYDTYHNLIVLGRVKK